MNPRANEIHPLDDYKLEIIFESGEKGIFDCKSLLDFGVFKELKNIEYFKQAKMKFGTVVWPHEQDICPDTLYIQSKKIS